MFKFQESTVRRRYSDFFVLKKLLKKENSHVLIPSLPERPIFKNRFDDEFIEARCKGLQHFMKR